MTILDIELFDTAPNIVCGTPTTGDAKTANPFSAYDGESVNGQWVLAVVDTANQRYRYIKLLDIDDM